MWTEERLNKMLTTPSEALSWELGRLEGDILVLGAGGKMGPTLCVLAKNALRAAGVEKRVIAVSRFSDPLVVELLRENGVEMISADLLAPGALDSLPDAENVIYMAGKKFGTDGNEYATWAMNTWLPSRVAERYQNSRIVVFSSGNLYPKVGVHSGGATEETRTEPVGEYCMSCQGRERMFEYAAKTYGTRVAVYRLNYAVDLRYGVLSDAAQAEGLCLEVRLEIDTGAGRTGVPLEHAAALAQRIAAMPGLRLTGIYTFKGLIYQGAPTQDNILAAKEEGEMMAEAARSIRAAGVAIQDVSAGSSPTGVAVAQTGLVTEVRPGTYIFKDQMLCGEHVAEPEQIAVRYAATVVSVQHGEYAVLDGGSKTFATDIPLNAPPFYYPGYAAVEGRPDLCLSRMNEEHGILTAACGQTKLKVGDVLTLVPIHVCTAVNQQNAVYLLENGHLTRHPVDARGMTV